MLMIPLGDALGFIITASVLFLFSTVLGGYYLISFISQIIRGPSPQVRSLGHSVLDPPAVPPTSEDSQESSKAA